MNIVKVICHLSFVIGHWSLVIRSLVIGHWSLEITVKFQPKVGKAQRVV
ncbi:hypothetical protein LC605_24910 [Nostoc sp. CHAB 5836]|nr:hypothetical protein [Nostoc sp. CHAB 5836]MCC5618267.1 hypothetical protein [Nostoc sp. CHAB 5836]